MKMTDLRAKARAIFGPAIAEPMPKQPNGAKALQQRANARPIPTYKVGGVVKKPTPTPADLAAAKAQNEMIKKATVSKRDAATIAAGNRMSREEGAEMKKMKMAVGGKVPAPNKMSVDYGPVKSPAVSSGKAAPKSALQDALMKMSQPTPPLPAKISPPSSQERKPKIELSASGKARLEAGAADEYKKLQARLALQAKADAQKAAKGVTPAQKAAKGVTPEIPSKISPPNMPPVARLPEAPPTREKSSPPNMPPVARLPEAPPPEISPPVARLPKAPPPDLRDISPENPLVDTWPRMNMPSGPPPAGMAPVNPGKAAMMKKGGKVQTSSDTARKLASEMGGMKKGGKTKPKNGLAVMIAIGSPKKPAKKMDGGPMGYMDGGEPMGYAAGGAGKMRKGQAPIKKAQGGAAKVRKGMMSPEGNIINAMNKMRGK